MPTKNEHEGIGFERYTTT